MKLKPRCVNRSSRAVLGVAVAGVVVCFGSISWAQAQTEQAIQLVDYSAPSYLSRLPVPHFGIQTNAAFVTDPKGRDIGDIIKPGITTSADRWTKFESEYGIEQESLSPIGRMFQVAKYGLDRMTFTAQETAKKCEFNYDLGCAPPNESGSRSAAPQYSLPMFGRFGRAQMKSEVTIHDPQTGQAFIGLKLSIPFGQGG
jgi:hypothetical protein